MTVVSDRGMVFCFLSLESGGIYVPLHTSVARCGCLFRFALDSIVAIMMYFAVTLLSSFSSDSCSFRAFASHLWLSVFTFLPPPIGEPLTSELIVNVQHRCAALAPTETLACVGPRRRRSYWRSTRRGTCNDASIQCITIPVW